MFWLRFIPDETLEFVVFNILVIGGIGLLISFVGAMIPPMRPYRPAINLISCILLIVGSYFQGGFNKEKEYHERIVEMQKKLDVAQEHSKHENIRIEKEVNDRLNKLKGKVNETKKVIEEHRVVIDSDCALPDVARMLYNRSIGNEVSRTPSKSNETGTKSGTTGNK
jgi:hypothetical protein